MFHMIIWVRVVLTLKMTTAQVVETSVTKNSLSQNYPHLDNHAKHITDTCTPGFKPFTRVIHTLFPALSFESTNLAAAKQKRAQLDTVRN